jgi:hypothetical protein
MSQAPFILMAMTPICDKKFGLSQKMSKFGSQKRQIAAQPQK